MSERPTLIVMAKAPRIGHGKSRLAADVGSVEAWRINRRLHASTMRAAIDPRWRALLCVTPDYAVDLRLPGVWPASLHRFVQGGGDLGERLARALKSRRRVAVIGTDCLELRRAHVAAAFAALQRKPFAIGLAHDGGFWILAARSGARAARAMEGVRWSTPYAARDVMDNLGARDVALIARLRDIDALEDYREATRRSSGV